MINLRLYFFFKFKVFKFGYDYKTYSSQVQKSLTGNTFEKSVVGLGFFFQNI